MHILVTGKSGCGKSFFAHRLAQQLNYQYIDIDKIGHMIYSDETMCKKLYDIFGNSIIGMDGKINRKSIGKIIFNNPTSNLTIKFNNITQEFIENQIDRILEENAVLDWALLPKTKYWNNNNIKILVKAHDDEMRINRISTRDNISKSYIKIRDNAIDDYNEDEFNYIIVNDYTLTNIDTSINKIIKLIKNNNIY